MVWRIEKGEKMEWNGMRRMVFPNEVSQYYGRFWSFRIYK